MRTLQASERRAGFSLLELVVVITIMAIVAGAAIPVTSKVLTYHARKETKSEIAGLAEACAEFFRDTERLPITIAELLVDPGASDPGWTGPYLPGVVADQLSGKTGYEVDAWSRDYRLTILGDVLTIASQGEDATWGTSTDVAVDVDVTFIRREKTLERLEIVNRSISLYIDLKQATDPELPANWTAAYAILVGAGFLPNDSDYLNDAWGDTYVEDPVGSLPVVKAASINVP